MDRPLGADPKDLRELLSVSARFESAAGPCQPAQGLELLDGLGQITLESLPRPALKPRAEATLAEQPKPAPTSTAQPQPAVPVSFVTSHPEYEGALQDRSLISALLVLGKTGKAVRKTNRPADSARFTQVEEQAFEPALAPRIDAQPKPTAAERRLRSTRIFRPL
jgi:hypothetical protein